MQQQQETLSQTQQGVQRLIASQMLPLEVKMETMESKRKQHTEKAVQLLCLKSIKEIHGIKPDHQKVKINNICSKQIYADQKKGIWPMF